MNSFISELRRRNVFKVGIAYLVVAWLLLQIVNNVVAPLRLPDWTATLIIVLFAVGFPIALLLAWAFDLTPRGVERAAADASAQPRSVVLFGRKSYLVVAAVLAVAVGSFMWMARERAPVDATAGDRASATLADVERHIGAGDWESAFAAALAYEQSHPDDPALHDLWPRFSWSTRIPSEPLGATVYRRGYDEAADDWTMLGTTPIDAVRVPYGLSVLRFELEGHRPLLATIGGGIFGSTELSVDDVTNTLGNLNSRVYTLDPVAILPEDMVRVPRWRERVAEEMTEFRDFFLARYEVTNREFKAFVDAGGYRRPELWEHAFIANGQEISWEAAMSRFVDQTGRPGPSTWEAGTHRDGEADYPVGGVSWYEAAAYARSVGRDLPTLHHWRRAFAPGTMAWQLPASNFSNEAPLPVGSSGGMGWTGTFDMSGNVREWVFNAYEPGERRGIPGGGWNDALYAGLFTFDAQPPMDRSPTNGFRVAILNDEPAALTRSRLPLPEPERANVSAVEPVSDEVFAAYRDFYAYDSTPLNAAVEDSQRSQLWTREHVSFDAAYGGERMGVYLYLPTSGSPPYQTVLYWPGSPALFLDSVDDYPVDLDYVLKDGRAVAFPVLKGMFERGDRSPLPPPGSMVQRDQHLQWVKDMRRTVDYLETRADIDARKLAYFGYSWGGVNGPLVFVTEPRIKAGVLHIAGTPVRRLPEVDPNLFLPRVRTPVLMLSGEQDVLFPLETSAKPFFATLGTPDKRHVIEPGGHFVPRATLIRETLDWLDRYLGRAR